MGSLREASLSLFGENRTPIRSFALVVRASARCLRGRVLNDLIMSIDRGRVRSTTVILYNGGVRLAIGFLGPFGRCESHLALCVFSSTSVRVGSTGKENLK